MVTAIPPRAHYLTEPPSADRLKPPQFDPALSDDWLPAELRILTGAVRSVQGSKRGFCNMLLVFEAERGTFVLKVVRGGYRSQELWAEHTAMQFLYGSAVPVPRSLAFLRQGELSFNLREHIIGKPLSILLETKDVNRLDAIREAAKVLAAIHRVRLALEWSWEEWIDWSLEQAARNMAAGILDPEEFPPDEPPIEVLDRLGMNRPIGGGSVCLLHGDYRPKNILWQDNGIAGLIDWSFVDVGDPYYDLGILRWYIQDEAEWQEFLTAYGLAEFDRERFEYCSDLQRFLNA